MRKIVNGQIMEMTHYEIEEFESMKNEVTEPEDNEKITLEELAKRQERTDEAVQDLILMMMEG